MNPVDREGRRGIEGCELPSCDGAAQNRSVQHVWKFDVVGVAPVCCKKSPVVRAWNTSTNHPRTRRFVHSPGPIDSTPVATQSDLTAALIPA
jgi:hypothetical protein